MFGLEVRRHRLFESSVDLGWPPFACACAGESAKGRMLNFHNTQDREAYRARVQRPGERLMGRELMARAYGIDHMATEQEVTEAIPPAYTEWIGTQLIRAIEQAA